MNPSTSSSPGSHEPVTKTKPPRNYYLVAFKTLCYLPHALAALALVWAPMNVYLRGGLKAPFDTGSLAAVAHIIVVLEIFLVGYTALLAIAAIIWELWRALKRKAGVE